MFGYVNVNQEKLSEEQKHYYQGFYCGLCDSLKKRYGNLSRLSLNNDLCFVALLLTSLYECETKISKKRCLIHPCKQHYVASNEMIDYACDMTIVLTYYKCVDDWEDEKKKSSKAYMYLLQKAFNKVEKLYPHKVVAIRQALDEGNEIEKHYDGNIDELLKCSGKMMEAIMVYKDDEYSRYLKVLANYLGRFIYLLDAYDDVLEDKKLNRFNPLFDEYQKEGFDDKVNDMLEAMIAISSEAYEFLPIVENNELLRNILYGGVWVKFMQIKEKRLGDKDGSL